jgi:hypothetical protein
MRSSGTWRFERREEPKDGGKTWMAATCGTAFVIVWAAMLGFGLVLLLLPRGLGDVVEETSTLTAGRSISASTYRRMRDSVGDRWSETMAERTGANSTGIRQKTRAKFVGACSRECRCSRGGLMQYGRWCGFGYTGCVRDGACDALDACCMAHDACVDRLGLMACECHYDLVVCAACAYSSDPTGSWCPSMTEAAANTVADIEYMFPRCIEAGEAGTWSGASSLQ